MTVGSRILGAIAKLPPAQTHDVAVERDLEVKMTDGAVLLADRWHPSHSAEVRPPVVLVRSPYGRHQLGVVGRLLAERGYQVVIQSCRGTFGSGGDWEPFRHEREDGLETLEWLADQQWFGGESVTFGPSYLGLTQWAVADQPPTHLRAMAPSVTARFFRDAVIYPGDCFALETALTWVHQVEHQELSPLRVLLATASSRRILRSAYAVLPLSEVDRRAVGRHVGFFQDWLAHDAPGDPWWEPVDFARRLDNAPPASLVGGWYDCFLPSQVADYEAMQRAGRPSRLTIGPWTHMSPGGMATSLRDGLDWFEANLRGRSSQRRDGVRLFVMGSRRWVDVHAWPPPADVQRWSLGAGGRLDPEGTVAQPGASQPDRYHYDPADPTPGIGGPSLDWRNAGPRDQRRREVRPDVLTYSSDPLAEDLTVAGPLTADLHLRSSVGHTDFFVRLCDVSPKGRSTNLSDGIVRLRPGAVDKAPNGSFRLRIAMWPTANTFRSGHRVRLQVSSGAHPLLARNTGGGHSLASDRSLWPAELEVFHDAERPSAIELPVSPI